MKFLTRIAVLCSLTVGLNVNAQLVERHDFGGLSLAIPDGDATGAFDTQFVVSSIASIADLNVSLTLSGQGGAMFNGDIYATLLHDSGFAVLLNRAGRRTGGSLGYSDNGFDVTLDDDEPESRDIHTYRLVMTGNESIGIGVSPLTGVWQPDGRSADPDSVLSSSPRDSFLSAFDGLSAGGNWTLFLADMEPGAAAKLDSWSLEITAVPEPEIYAAATALGLLCFAWARRRARQK